MRFNLFLICFLLYNTANSQSTLGFEQLYYIDNPGASPAPSVVPRIYYSGRNNCYGEVRYNYEEVRTLSLYAGRTFSKQDSLSWSFTPVAGLLLGKLKGGAVGVNATLNYRKLSFYSSMQYTFSRENKHSNFIYSWSDLDYLLTGGFYAGLVIQQTRFYNTNNKWDPGLLLGFLVKTWTFPLYAFNPMSNDRRFVIGVTKEWDWKGQHGINSTHESGSRAIKFP
jgi:hypothetical protein